MLKLIVFACVSVVAAQNVGQDAKLVTIAQGSVLGHKNHDHDIFEFFGIPYATAPTGTQRFTAPLPAPSWPGTLDAVDRGIICPQQLSFGYPGKTIEEDCLIANVYTPDTEETNLPVVVIIHGGGYVAGFGHLMAPRRLVGTKKMVAVTFNYRLGAHGFLCLGTKGAPGNAGSKDQVALLRWVKNNIARFGGNPEDVTISGFSAGASSVDLLMLSKSAEGLFNKVIPESGSNVASWSAQQTPVKGAQDYAKLLNFTNVDDLEALEEFYKTVPYDTLNSITEVFKYNSNVHFSPCVENDLGEEMFLNDSPVRIIQEGRYTKLPILYGLTDMEGLVFIDVFDDWVSVMNEKFSLFLPDDLEFTSEEEKETVAQSIKSFYFGSSSIGVQTLFQYISFFSDVFFSNYILRSAKMQIEAGHDSIYFYEYTFFKMFPSVPGVPDALINNPGAGHTDQTVAVLDISLYQVQEEMFTEEYQQMRATMLELWSNFIVTGQPVPEGSSLPAWPPAAANCTPYMHLGETIDLRDTPMIADRIQFWDDIYERYYRHPKPPTSGANLISHN